MMYATRYATTVAGWLARIRGATPPIRNGLSHAGKHRDAAMAEKLFWGVLAHLQNLQPRLGDGRKRRGLTRRFRRTIHVVDSTNNFEWWPGHHS